MKRLLGVLALCLVAVAFLRAPGEDAVPRPINLRIRLRWVKAYEAENAEKVTTGLAWSLSFLGARRESPMASLMTPLDPQRPEFDLDLGKAGFDPGVHRPLSAVLDALRDSGEYEATGSIDIGRFIVTLLHIAPHYYAITDAAPDLATFYRRHDFSKSASYAVMNSTVARHHRVIRFVQEDDAARMAFVAEEGTGSPASGDFKATAFETIDVMANGDLRFAIYDSSGRLTHASPPLLGDAGKPGKCMWCHESSVQPVYFDTPDVPGYLTRAQFARYIEQARERLDGFRRTLPGGVDFSKTRDHGYSELLYISFMEPSLTRLANEWRMEPAAVSVVMKGLPTHEHEEFPYLGVLYDRSVADARAPWAVLPGPSSVREPIGREPSVLPAGGGPALRR